LIPALNDRATEKKEDNEFWMIPGTRYCAELKEECSWDIVKQTAAHEGKWPLFRENFGKRLFVTGVIC